MKKNSIGHLIFDSLRHDGPASSGAIASRVKRSLPSVLAALEILQEENKVSRMPHGAYEVVSKDITAPLPAEMKWRTCIFCGSRPATILAKDCGKWEPACDVCLAPVKTKGPIQKIDTEVYKANIERAIRLLGESGEEITSEAVCTAMGLDPQDNKNAARAGRYLRDHAGIVQKKPAKQASALATESAAAAI